MADFEKKVSLIEIEIDNASAKAKVDELSDAIFEQTKAVKSNADEIKSLNKANAELEKEVKKGTITEKEAAKQIEENTKKSKELEKQNFNLKDELKDLNKERGNAIKATKLQSNSLDALRKVVADQKRELNGLNTETEEGRKRFDELSKALKNNNEKIRELDQGAGDYKTTVGNYREEVVGAIKDTGLFGGVIGKLTQAKEVATKALTLYKGFLQQSTKATIDNNRVLEIGTGETEDFADANVISTKLLKAKTLTIGGTSKALKIFRLALISTGIGAIVVLLGSLISAFLSTQEGIDKVTAVTRPFFAVLNKLKGLVQELASGAFAGLAQILNGDISEGLSTLKGAFTDAISGVGDAVKGGIEAGKELDQLQKSIERTEISLITNRARLNNEFEKQKSIAEDVTKSEKERIAAAQASQAALKELQDEEQKLIDLKIRQKELENSLNDTSREDEKELAELIAQRTEFEAAATAKIVSVRNLENSIKSQIANEEKARIQELAKTREQAAAEEEKIRQENLKKAEEAAKKQAEIDKQLAEEKAQNQMVLNQKLLALAEFRRSQANEGRLKEIEDTKEYFQLKEEIELENFERERERLAEQALVTLEDEALTAEEKAIQQAEIDLALEELKARHADRMVEIEQGQKDRELAIEQEKANKRKSIFMAGQQAIQAGLDISNNVINNFYNKRYANIQKQLENGQITEEQYAKKKESLDKNKAKSLHKAQVAEFRIKKLVNIGTIIADTAKSIAAAVSASPLTGGLPFSAINAGLGAAQLAAVITEKAPPPPTFAQGGDVFGVIAGGNRHSAGGTKYRGEDGNTIEVERGEGLFVTKREATNPALQMLNQANTMAGGRSMFSGSSRFLQDGGEASRQGDAAMMARMISEAMMNAPVPVLPVQSVMAGINSETKAKKVGVI